MTDWSSGHVDGKVFQAFVKCVGIYPVVSLVRMQSGRLGVVVEQSEKSLLAPKVKVFFSTKANARRVPEVLETASLACRDRITGCEAATVWSFPDFLLLWGSSAAAT